MKQKSILFSPGCFSAEVMLSQAALVAMALERLMFRALDLKGVCVCVWYPNT